MPYPAYDALSLPLENACHYAPPDGGKNALSGLRFALLAVGKRMSLRTAGWRHKCLIRPTMRSPCRWKTHVIMRRRMAAKMPYPAYDALSLPLANACHYAPPDGGINALSGQGCTLL
ncbi:hypothetical protein NNO02_03135 [Citrobacter sp. Awk 2]|uniref:hypothetical protein n=1 Tax=Citrobacter sp. Awk 2 TaxID=2963959 RepID=UPI002304940C|nr:hypothetical protein [Citrobacter sp. Awk 2]MDA8501443.1 hypothetical protein [Citrobacter sp. Awk 2]